MTISESNHSAGRARYFKMNNGEDMKRLQQLTAIIEREGDGYVGLCPELDIASQGDTIESARKNLQEAVELFSETADLCEIGHRFGTHAG